METQINTTIVDDADADETLSLRDLPIHDADANSLRSSPRTSTSTQDLFEFFSGTDPYPNRPDIIFCGKVIPTNTNTNTNEENNHKIKRDHFGLTNSMSFRFRLPERSVSDRVHGSGSTRSGSEPPVKFSSSVKKVNITSLTAMSASSRRRMFMFGPVKFKPEMELSAIKERQGRRAPVRMFPAVVGGGGETVGNGGGGKGIRCSHGSHWGIVMNLKCRAQRDHLSTVLVRSLSCISNH